VLLGGGVSTHRWARAPMWGAAGSPSSHHPSLTACLYYSRKISRGVEKKGVREKIVGARVGAVAESRFCSPEIVDDCRIVMSD
jgi:hypothetical protein